MFLATLGLDNAYGAAGLRTAILLYVFSSLDAFFTAREVNLGLAADQDGSARVAALLNLLLPGIGYLYLAERVKGLAFFAGFWVFNATFAQGGGLALGLLSELVAAGIAVDAYRTAARVRAGFVSASEATTRVEAQFPAAIPLGCAGVLLAGYVGLLVLGVAVVLLGKG